jgi:integral membrane protein (TIGR01906 family)
MRILLWGTGLILATSLLVGLWLTSIEYIAFDLSYYDKQYMKYDISTCVEIQQNDLLHITENMLLYIKGKRSTLDMQVIQGNVMREVFSTREKKHMEDVQMLFLKGYEWRKWCGILFLICICFLISHKEGIYTLFKSIKIVSVVGSITVGFLGLVVYHDFTASFTIFHHIFFDNDLWLLDPAEDILISIVPEPFFVDTAALFVKIIVSLLVGLFLLSTLILHRYKKSRI